MSDELLEFEVQLRALLRDAERAARIDQGRIERERPLVLRDRILPALGIAL